jgi:hypothetical protein
MVSSQRLPRSTGKNITGLFPTVKAKRIIRFESLLECDCLHLLNYSPYVSAIQEQPFGIDYLLNGKNHRYTPDFCVTLIDGSNILIEVKPEIFLKSEDTVLKINVLADWCRANSCAYIIATDTYIRQGHRLKNIKLLFPFSKYSPKPDIQNGILSILENKPTTIHDICQNISPAYALHDLYQMAYHHRVYLPIADEKINENTLVTLPEKKALDCGSYVL